MTPEDLLARIDARDCLDILAAMRAPIASTSVRSPSVWRRS